MLDRRFLDINLVVQGIANSPAANPAKGTQYIVGSSPTGAFSGATANQLARYNGSKWIFTTPKAGQLEVLNVETKEVLSFDGTEWKVKTTLSSSGESDSNDSVITIDDFALNTDSVYTYSAEESTMLFGTILVNPDAHKVYTITQGYISDGQINRECMFASKTDGKLYKHVYINDSSLSSDEKHKLTSKDIPDNATLLNRHTCVLYRYNALDKSFSKISNQYHVVDDIVDFMCWDFTANQPKKITFSEGSKRLTNTALQEYKDGAWVSLANDYVTVGKKYIARESAFGKNVVVYERSAGNEWNTMFSYQNWVSYVLEAGDYFINKADGLTYMFDGTTFIAITSSGSGGSVGAASEVICETHTLTAAEATAQSFTLANSIKSGKENDIMLSVCGVVQIAGVDYTASGNTISWSDKSLADIGLQAGDVFIVHYVKA